MIVSSTAITRMQRRARGLRIEEAADRRLGFRRHRRLQAAGANTIVQVDSGGNSYVTTLSNVTLTQADTDNNVV
jgi:hypothetical protein